MNLQYTYSAESQDLFVASVLDNKTQGTFLEIGSREPRYKNNTYLLEQIYGWRGIAVEWDKQFADIYNQDRLSPCICADATELEYAELIETAGFGAHIDYLQIDLETDTGLKTLQNFDLVRNTFSVITYEHDYGSQPGGAHAREESRRILEAAGYTRVISDAATQHNVTGLTPYANQSNEDWYILESHMPNENWKRFVGEFIITTTDHRDSTLTELFNELVKYPNKT